MLGVIQCSHKSDQKITIIIEKEGMEHSPATKDRLTLEEYLQAHRIRKQIEERHRSRSKGKNKASQKEQEKGVNGFYHKLDHFLNDTKISIQQVVSAADVNPEKLFFHLSKLLDGMIADLKEEIRKLFRDIYSRIEIEREEKGNSVEAVDHNFFRVQVSEAKEQKKKGKLSETVKQSFRNEHKNKNIIESIMGGAMEDGSLIPNIKVTAEQKVGSNPAIPIEQPNSFMMSLLGLTPLKSEIMEEKEQPNIVKEKPKNEGNMLIFKKNTLDIPPALSKKDSEFITAAEKRENKKPFERRTQPGARRTPTSKQKK